MNKDILNNIYRAFSQYGVEKEHLTHFAHFQNDLKISQDTLNDIFNSLERKVGIPLSSQFVSSPANICELEEYLLSSIN